MKRAISILLSLVALAALGPTASSVQAAPASAKKKPDKARDKKHAEAVVAHWIQAVGGSASLRDLTSIHLEQRIDSGERFSGMYFSSDEFVNDHYRYEFTGGDSVSGGFDGKLAWYRSGALGFGRVETEDFRTWIWRSEAIIARDLPKYYPKFEYQGGATVDGAACDVLTMTGADGRDELWYIETKTGHLLKIVRPASSQVYGFTATFGDFRRTGGLTAPFRVTVVNPASTSTAERLAIDAARLPEEDTAPPARALDEFQRTEAVLQHYLAAIGGKSAIDAVHSRVTKSTVELSSSGVATKTTLSQKDPNFILREELSPGLGTTFTGFDGQIGWVNSEVQGFRRLKSDEIAQWKHRSKIEGELDLASQYPLHKYAGSREIDGKKTDVLALATIESFGGYFYFDAETGFLVRVETQVNIGPKTLAPATMDLSDYRPVDALKVPFKTVWHTPTNTLMTTYQSIAFNVPLPDEMFKERRDD